MVATWRMSCPSWASFIAANLAVDDILTTFVATTRSRSIHPLAQRARKILQGGGRAPHACGGLAQAHLPQRGAMLDPLLRRIAGFSDQAARWPGTRPSDPGLSCRDRGEHGERRFQRHPQPCPRLAVRPAAPPRAPG